MPIVQGGMGVGVSLAGLASAVANQGGVGVISSAGLGAIYNNYSKDYRAASIWGLKEELRKAREATKGIIGVNVMVAMSNFADMVKTAIAEKMMSVPRRAATWVTRPTRSPTSTIRSKPSFRRSWPRSVLSRPSTTAAFR